MNHLLRPPILYKKVLEICNSENYEKILYLSHVKKGHTVFDIGANAGNFTILFSNIVGKKGKVFSFEAVPKTFEYLSRKVESLKIQNVILENLAVGDKQGNFNIYTPGNDSGQSSLMIQNRGSWKNSDIQKVTCSMVTLDKFIKKNNIERLDFIKCDIEGAELMALKGGSKSLIKFRPRVLLEINSDWTKAFDYTPKEILKYLHEIGYNSFTIADQNFKKHDLESACCLDFSKGGHNIFCTCS